MLSLVLLALLAGPPELSPGTNYDAAIPTMKKVLGYDHGEEISTGEGFITYFKALEAGRWAR